ncbi:MAG: DUF2721 domain-containing protein [Cyclobacteriaceae bacterium]|nr:DUF2721 domain-containing protein [Cyclobacteriaceae bacterium]
MTITINTPALLFPAITLLLLAYTNRFLAVATLIRSLHKKHLEFPNQKIILIQIKNLRMRIHLIKWMQIFGVISFVFCVLSMFLIFQNLGLYANFTFGGSMFSLLVSLFISLRELLISTSALEVELGEMES